MGDLAPAGGAVGRLLLMGAAGTAIALDAEEDGSAAVGCIDGVNGLGKAFAACVGIGVAEE